MLDPVLQWDRAGSGPPSGRRTDPPAVDHGPPALLTYTPGGYSRPVRPPTRRAPLDHRRRIESAIAADDPRAIGLGGFRALDGRWALHRRRRARHTTP